MTTVPAENIPHSFNIAIGPHVVLNNNMEPWSKSSSGRREHLPDSSWADSDSANSLPQRMEHPERILSLRLTLVKYTNINWD